LLSAFSSINKFQFASTKKPSRNCRSTPPTPPAPPFDSAESAE
jgi:hypothetical protein